MPQSISETTKFIAELNKRFKDKKNIFWVIVSKKHNQIIGTIGYQNFNNNFSYAEIGYELDPDNHKKGYMNESCKAVLNFGLYSMNLKTIEAFTHKDNEASKALLKKHQFVFQVERREDGFENNRIFLFSIFMLPVTASISSRSTVPILFFLTLLSFFYSDKPLSLIHI